MAPNIGLAILNIDLDSFPILNHNITVNLSAKLTITCKWRTDLVPSSSEAVNMTQLHYAYERAIAIYADTNIF